MTGLALAYAVTAGIIGARETGIGQDMDVSLFDIAMANTAYPAIWYLNEGYMQERVDRSAHPILCPCQLYKTQDSWIYLMCNKEKFWPILCKILGQDEWIRDERFKNSPIKCGESRTPARPAPKIGADTLALLKSIGYNDLKISDLKKKNIV